MNTAELHTGVRPTRTARVSDPAIAPRIGKDVPIVVVSDDQALRDAIRAAASEGQDVHCAACLQEANSLAARGRCGILVTDQALSQAALAKLSAQLHAHDPAAVTIAVGTRGDDQALIGLLSSSVVERFMMKPVVPSMARLVLRSAASEYRSQQVRPRNDTIVKEPTIEVAAPDSDEDEDEGERESIIAAMNRVRPLKAAPLHEALQTPAPPAEVAPVASPAPTPVAAPRSSTAIARTTRMWGPATWMWIVSGIAAVIAVSWWAVYSPASRADITRIIAANLSSAQAALASGRETEPAENSALHYFSLVLALDPSNAIAQKGMQDIAGKLSEQVKTLILDGRLAEAGIALERARRLSNDSRRIGLLEAELKRVQSQQLQILNAPPEPTNVTVSAEKRPAAAPIPAPTAAKAVAHETFVPIPKESPASPTPDVEAMPASQVFPELTAPAQVHTTDIAPLTSSRTSDPAGSAEPAPQEVPPPSSGPPRAPPLESVEHPQPKLAHMVPPVYPVEARMRGIDGWVDLTLTVNAAGEVSDARVDASSKRMFERSAMAAVRKWRYEPMTLPSPEATESVKVKVEFRIN